MVCRCMYNCRCKRRFIADVNGNLDVDVDVDVGVCIIVDVSVA